MKPLETPLRFRWTVPLSVMLNFTNLTGKRKERRVNLKKSSEQFLLGKKGGGGEEVYLHIFRTYDTPPPPREGGKSMIIEGKNMKWGKRREKNVKRLRKEERY